MPGRARYGKSRMAIGRSWLSSNGRTPIQKRGAVLPLRMP